MKGLQLALARILSEFPYLCSPLEVIDKALEAADMSHDDLFVDLGCGDGTVLLRAAERFRVFSVGFEINPVLVKIARRRAHLAGLNDLIEIIHSDLFTADLSRFNVIYVYPSPLVIERLSRKIMYECVEGTRVLIHDYPLRNIEPDEVIRISGGPLHTHSIYVYRIKDAGESV